MEIEEAIQTSIKYETKVRDVYKDAVQSAEDSIGKRVFNVLVQEEEHHLQYLEKKLEELKNTGAVTVEGLETHIPQREKIDDEVNKLKAKLEPSESDRKYHNVELQSLKKALEIEIETSEFYNKMVSELPEDGKALFRRFVEIEEGHKIIVQAEIDAVSGLGYWFDMPEFDLAGN